MDADDARALVSAMLADLIGPEPDPVTDAGTLNRLTDRLAARGDCSEILHELLVSDSCCHRLIGDAYRAVLGRGPRDDETQAHTASIRAGRVWPTSLPLVLLEPIVRDESRTVASRFALVYAVVLDREVSVAEIDFWTRRLRRRFPAALLDQIWSSPEAVAYRIAQLYRTHLWRDPDQSGFSTWTRPLLDDGDEPVRAGLVSSLEYLLLARERAATTVRPKAPGTVAAIA